MKLGRVMIAAPKSGSGKTTVTCGLLWTLKEMGLNPVSFKCGPDYIDPMFHKTAIGVSSKNLDTFFTDEETTLRLMLDGRQDGDFAVLEGVMGLYDGLGGVREEGSSYHLAKVTKTPIILVVDAKGMGRSVISLIAGFLSYDTEKLIKGVILNRTSKSFYEIIAPLIEEELGIRTFGYVPDKPEFKLESRHLGLTLPGEVSGVREKLELISNQLRESLSVDNIINVGMVEPGTLTATMVEPGTLAEPGTTMPSVSAPTLAVPGSCKVPGSATPVIAVACDNAFCFYYDDNLSLLKKHGAVIKYFSPISDKKLPDNTSAILIGGGYPEMFLKELSENTSMLDEIRKAYNLGMPIIAECGGFMYLHDSISDKEGTSYKMTGIIPGGCVYKNKSVRFGYIELTPSGDDTWLKKISVKGHEFHYYDCDENGDDFTAVKPVTGKKYPCIINRDNLMAGFPHLYYPSDERIAETIVKKASEYGKLI